MTTPTTPTILDRWADLTAYRNGVARARAELRLARITGARPDLADRTRFVLPADRFDAFVALLDTAPEPAPRLVALFASPTRITT